VHQDHTPTPLVVINPKDLAPAVLVVRAEILRMQRKGAGSYVFIDNAMNAYVVSELRSVAAAWVRDRFTWLVAFYAPRRRDGSKRNPDKTPFMAATVSGLTEDFQQHLADQRQWA
jgi:hypothetical protein